MKEAASQARVSVQLLKRAISEGDGPAATRLGHGHSRIMIRQDCLEEWIARRTVPPRAVVQQPALENT